VCLYSPLPFYIHLSPGHSLPPHCHSPQMCGDGDGAPGCAPGPKLRPEIASPQVFGRRNARAVPKIELLIHAYGALSHLSISKNFDLVSLWGSLFLLYRNYL
jgi:hypothetical protein